MKRIKLTDTIYSIITENLLFINGNDTNERMKAYRIAKFVSENYRRRIHKTHKYTCTSCSKILNAGKLCKCKGVLK